MSTQPKTFVSPEEYLERERRAEYKSEYHNGEIFAMSGASRRHNRLAFRLYTLLGTHLRGKKCEGFPSDMRVLVEVGHYTYPDMSVVCDEPQFADSFVDTLINPTLVVEIISPSTEQYDRGTKAKLYRAIPSLREFLLISQDRKEIELYRRSANDAWTIIDATGADASIELTSINFTLSLRELYEGILPEEPSLP